MGDFESDYLNKGVPITPAYEIPQQAQLPLSTAAPETIPESVQITTTSRALPRPPVIAPVALPNRTQPQPHFRALQKWQGIVSEVTDETFTAQLLDLFDPSNEEVAEFELEEVSRGDLCLVRPGAVFYWSIGYLTEPSGSRSRTSVLVFRRLPAWSEKDIEQAKSRARELQNSFGWCNNRFYF